MTTRTVCELIAELGLEIDGLLSELLLKHSRLIHDPVEGLLRMGVISAAFYGDFVWAALPPEGERLRSKVNKQYARFMDLVRVLTRAEVDSVRRRIEEPDRLVRRAIDRNDRPWTGDPKDVLTEIQEALRRIISVVASVYGEARGEPVVVPDTNALLENPRLESWAFEEFPRFTMVLVPEVLAELDRLKTEHRDPSMRDTVRRLVRQIGEYRRRGSLAEGVTLVKGISRVKAVATEPDFGASLPWLDRKVPDDRILAAFIEVMREHPESPAALATFDVNLQSKADFARLPLVEPPEPARPSEAAQHESSR